MKAIVLAAGYGTRLKKVTKNTAKPLLAVNGIPIIERILAKLETATSISEVHIVTNDRYYFDFQRWAITHLTPFKLYIYNDGSTSPENRLGAIRDILFALKHIQQLDDTLVIAGDNLFEFDIRKFIVSYRRKCMPIIAVKDVESKKEAMRFGVISLGPDRQITAFHEKPKNPATTLISTGCYIFPKKALSMLAAYVRAKKNPDAPGYFLQWLIGKQRVFGWPFNDQWFDIGSIESYHAANRFYRKADKALRKKQAIKNRAGQAKSKRGKRTGSFTYLGD